MVDRFARRAFRIVEDTPQELYIVETSICLSPTGKSNNRYRFSYNTGAATQYDVSMIFNPNPEGMAGL
jgi:hypothetical protein